MCDLFSVSTSAFYHWLNSKNSVNSYKVKLLSDILNIYYDSKGIYGSPKITAILRGLGYKISSRTVSKYMNILGIKSIVSSRFPHRKSTLTNNEKSLIINLIKNLKLSHINQVWTTDYTYIKTINEGTFYLVTFEDQFSKKIVGWALLDNLKTESLLPVLKKIIKSRKPSPGLIIHSDKGSQFRSRIYRDFLYKHNFVYSYTSLNHSCDENASHESWHSLLKKEWLSGMKLYTYEDAYKAIFDYIEGFYNPKRVHSSIGYLSPIQFEKSLS